MTERPTPHDNRSRVHIEVGNGLFTEGTYFEPVNGVKDWIVLSVPAMGLARDAASSPGWRDVPMAMNAGRVLAQEHGTGFMRIDNPGHGFNAQFFASQDYFTPELAVENIGAAVRKVKEMGYKNVVLQGESFGGVAAVEYAARHPEEIKGLVLASAPLNVQEVKDNLFGEYIKMGILDGPGYIPVASGNVRLGRGFFDGVDALDMVNSLQKYTGPVLCLPPTEDKLVSFERIAQIVAEQQAFRQASGEKNPFILLPVEGAGHDFVLPLEQQFFIDNLITFVKDLQQALKAY